MEISSRDFIVLCEPDSTFSSKDMCKFLAYIDDFECIFGTRTRKTLIQKGAKINFYLRIGNIAVAKYLEYILLQTVPNFTFFLKYTFLVEYFSNAYI